jgi:suppressor of ftsI
MTNPSGEVHPFHIHQNPFQVTHVNGLPYDGKGYNDTFPIPIGGDFTMRTLFEDFVGTFVFHCHVVFHEDAGMMLVIQVEP